MNEAHRGKIGPLPKALQEQVNRRLEAGEKGRALVAWLNGLPEVQAVLAAEFAGKPIADLLSRLVTGGFPAMLVARLKIKTPYFGGLN